MIGEDWTLTIPKWPSALNRYAIGLLIVPEELPGVSCALPELAVILKLLVEQRVSDDWFW